jgi:membrane-bound ClpP family serine protease
VSNFSDEDLLLLGMGLIAAGVLLVIVEVFIPSAGLIAITAAAVSIAGVVVLFQVSPFWGLLGAVALVILAPIAFFSAIKMMPLTPLGRRLMSAKDPEEIESDRRREEAEREAQLALLDAEGEAVTDLRPVGVVRIDGRRHDALAEGKWIEAGTRVRVTVILDNQVKVRPAE